ncbi:hypothetical protein [Silvimonas amylolytica]|nr:hypothetical protein [Silvimonas amylolytica]
MIAHDFGLTLSTDNTRPSGTPEKPFDLDKEWYALDCIPRYLTFTF